MAYTRLTNLIDFMKGLFLTQIFVQNQVTHHEIQYAKLNNALPFYKTKLIHLVFDEDCTLNCTIHLPLKSLFRIRHTLDQQLEYHFPYHRDQMISGYRIESINMTMVKVHAYVISKSLVDSFPDNIASTRLSNRVRLPLQKSYHPDARGWLSFLVFVIALGMLPVAVLINRDRQIDYLQTRLERIAGEPVSGRMVYGQHMKLPASLLNGLSSIPQDVMRIEIKPNRIRAWRGDDLVHKARL